MIELERIMMTTYHMDLKLTLNTKTIKFVGFILKNTIHYPSAHITNKVFSNKELKSPLDKEQAMLQGIVSNNTKDVNTHFKANKIYYQIQQLN